MAQRYKILNSQFRAKSNASELLEKYRTRLVDKNKLEFEAKLEKQVEKGKSLEKLTVDDMWNSFSYDLADDLEALLREDWGPDESDDKESPSAKGDRGNAPVAPPDYTTFGEEQLKVKTFSNGQVGMVKAGGEEFHRITRRQKLKIFAPVATYFQVCTHEDDDRLVMRFRADTKADNEKLEKAMTRAVKDFPERVSLIGYGLWGKNSAVLMVKGLPADELGEDPAAEKPAAASAEEPKSDETPTTEGDETTE